MARDPAFFRELGMPDTVIGRFEMLCVVMILYFRRTALAGPLAREIAQEIVEAFFEDLDHSMRELGIGDNGVPKRMKKFAGMFYGRLESYGKAMDAQDETALEIALRRNIHPENRDETLSMAQMAHYMMLAERNLKELPDATMDRGEATLVAAGAGENR